VEETIASAAVLASTVVMHTGSGMEDVQVVSATISAPLQADRACTSLRSTMVAFALGVPTDRS